VTAVEIARAVRERSATARYDVLAAPATPFSATPAGQKTLILNGAEIEIRPNLGVFTQPVSLAGIPVVTVPVAVPGALPLGVQLIGRANSENMLLALAAQLQRRGVSSAQPARALVPAAR
jgi:Asp-tRNA(Asn)/Glu-tRNA(Gln) amidotransferase A subunit family amidase